MKRILILLMLIAGFVLAFTLLDGVIRIICLFILFPLFFFYCPLIFAGEKKEEKTEEALREESGKTTNWNNNKWD